MKAYLVAVLGAAILAGCSPGPGHGEPKQAVQRPSDAQSEAYMRKVEEDWAETFVTENPALFERILADDFVAVFPSGAVRNKAQTIASEKPDPNFTAARIEAVTYRHFGDTVIAQGTERATRRDGGPALRLTWTDVWLFRDGQWRIIASHVAELPETKG